MHHGMLGAFVVIGLITGPAMAQEQSLGSEHARAVAPSESSNLTRTPKSSWETWLNHGAREGSLKSYVPSRSPNLGIPTAPLSPSIGPGSGLLGPEAGRSPSRLRSDRETEREWVGPRGGMR